MVCTQCRNLRAMMCTRQKLWKKWCWQPFHRVWIAQCAETTLNERFCPAGFHLLEHGNWHFFGIWQFINMFTIWFFWSGTGPPPWWTQMMRPRHLIPVAPLFTALCFRVQTDGEKLGGGGLSFSCHNMFFVNTYLQNPFCHQCEQKHNIVRTCSKLLDRPSCRHNQLPHFMR